MCKSSVGHPKYPTSGLKGGSLGKSCPNELLPRKFQGCPPFGGW